MEKHDNSKPAGGVKMIALPDSGSDEDEQELARTSEDVRRVDRETLTAEDEAEKLLAGEASEMLFGNFFTSNRSRASKRLKRRIPRSCGEQVGEDKQLIYQLEEGGPGQSSSSDVSSDRSSDVDVNMLVDERLQKRSKKSTRRRFGRFFLIYAAIISAFLALLYGAYRVSPHVRKEVAMASSTSYEAKSLSNGTHVFAPTTVLISLDGFRADFLHRNLTATLSSLIRTGVSPKFMLPSFPSLTFPNHFTLVTGLNPESHGIVGNTFWDPLVEKEFFYTDPDRSMQPEWWAAEPLWLTAELAGVRSAIHMWPGSEAHIGGVEPAYVDKFNADERLDRKVDRIFSWLDRPGAEDIGARHDQPRPQLIAAYVPNVDADGHLYGPNSTNIRGTIQEVDGMLASILRGIEERNLTHIVNIIVVSDHGMATTSVQRLIQLEDLIDTDSIAHIDGWPLYGLRPQNTSEQHLQALYQQLYAKSQLPEYQHAFNVYLRDKNMPERYNFRANPRIAPLWIVPHAGWAVVTRNEFDIAQAKQLNEEYLPRGLHGYDHEHPLMRAIFIARGPAFPHPQGSQVAVFRNTEVYNIVCDSLGISPKANNGTLRLPLRPEGLHDFDTPHDLPDDPSQEEISHANPLLPPALPGLDALPSVEAPMTDEMPAQPTQDSDGVEERPVIEDGNWLDRLIAAAKAWASKILGPDESGTAPNSTVHE